MIPRFHLFFCADASFPEAFFLSVCKLLTAGSPENLTSLTHPVISSRFPPEIIFHLNYAKR